MALLAMYGFEGAPDVSPGISNSGGTISAVTGRDGTGLAVANGGFLTGTLTVPVGSAVSTLIVQSAFKVLLASQAGASSDGLQVMSLFGDSGATNHLTISINSSNQLVLRRGTISGTVIATETGSRTDATWVYMEVKTTINDTTGTCVVRANGVEIINYVGDTKNGGTATTLDTVKFGIGQSSNKIPVDDVVIMDTTGSAPMNDFIGDHVIKGLRPSGNGAANQWTGSDGNSTDNYQLVDELPFSSADYVGDLTPGNQDIYVFDDLVISGTVRAVKPLLYAAKTDAGTRSVKALKRATSGAIVGSSDLALSTTYAILAGPIWETDADGAAWTVAGVNSAQFGVETV